MTITSFFLHIGIPALGLIPTIRIWDILSTGNILIINDEQCTEIGDGFYSYNFTAYDPTHNYVVRVDGGLPLADGERFNITAITPSTTSAVVDSVAINQIVNGVWSEETINHVDNGTFGLVVNQIKADTTNISLNVISAVDLLETLLKYEQNKTKIDKINKTLTVYDNDGITPIKIFQLKDSNGIPSVDEVCERLPL